MATSYSNTNGTGDRRATMAVAYGMLVSVTGTVAHLVDGSQSDHNFFFGSGDANAALYFFFDAPSGKSTLIDEAKWYQSTTDSHGTWQWQGSNDFLTWSNVGTTFTLGGATTQTITAINGYTTPYVFWRLKQTAGSTSGIPWLSEIEFQIASIQVAQSGPSHVSLGGRTGVRI